MRILALTYDAQPAEGGIQRFCHAVFRYMLSSGVDLCTYCHAHRTPLSGEINVRRLKYLDRFFLYERLRLAL